MALRSSAAAVVATARRLGGSAPARLAGRLFALGLVAYLAVRLWHLWRSDSIDLRRLESTSFVLAVLVSVAAVASYGLVWPYLLRRLGSPASPSWIGLFFSSQLGKYVPGSVWQYAGRVGLARGRGVPGGAAFASVVTEVTFSAVAAALVALLALGGAGGEVAWAAASIAALALVATGRRPVISLLQRVLPTTAREHVSAAVSVGPSAMALYIAVWAVYGMAFWLTAHAYVGAPPSQAPLYVGVFALGWLVGLVAVFAPGGVGVREAVIVGLLSGRIGPANAIILAALSRIVLTGVDLLAGAFALSLPLLLRRAQIRGAQT
jgi:uncharacterized membrane protein YbhN (UPF0104 family)